MATPITVAHTVGNAPTINQEMLANRNPTISAVKVFQFFNTAVITGLKTIIQKASTVSRNSNFS